MANQNLRYGYKSTSHKLGRERDHDFDQLIPSDGRFVFYVVHRYCPSVCRVSIKILCQVPPGSKFKVSLQSYTKLSDFQVGCTEIFSANDKGDLYVSMNMDYSYDHIGIALVFVPIGCERDAFFIRPNLSLVILIDKHGKSHVASYIHKDEGRIVKKFINNFFSEAVGAKKRLILIEPDLADKQGHFYAYANNLRKSTAKLGFDFVVLSSLKFLDRKMAEWVCPVFSKNTWTIATSRQVFGDELRSGLNAVNYKPCFDSVYMYTGSAFHAVEMYKIFEEKNGRGSCTLFWEMIKDIASNDYVNVFSELQEIAGFSDKIKLLSPTQEILDLVKGRFGVGEWVVPHPSTSVFDSEFRFPDQPEYLFNKKFECQPQKIFFPGVNTVHKGYEYGLEIASRLSNCGFDCYVRDVPGVEKRVGLKYVPLGLDDEVINDLFKSAALVVIPYLPSGFKARTSGLVVDALLNFTPAVVIENTWLAGHVRKYNSGICIGTDADCALPILLDYIAGFDRECFSELCDNAKSYVGNNSWIKLTKIALAGCDVGAI